jgi:hypothetical protein
MLMGRSRHWWKDTSTDLYRIIRGITSISRSYLARAEGAYDHSQMPISGNSECCGTHVPPIIPLHLYMPVTGHVSLVVDLTILNL